MCGDGTNDVGALKHAHVGVALISHSHPPKAREATTPASPTVAAPVVVDNRRSINDVFREAKERNSAPRNRRGLSERVPPPPLAGAVNAAGVGAGAPGNRHQQRINNAQEKMQKMLADLEEQEKAAIVKLGDASIAAPFTSKLSSIQCSAFIYLHI